MKIYVLIFVIILLILHMYIFQNVIFLNLKGINNNKLKNNRSDPVFSDFIITDVVSDIGSENGDRELSPGVDVDVLNTLDRVLKAQDVVASSRIIDTKEKEYNVSEMEIQNSVQAALAFRTSGKAEKALKLIEHAVSFAPNHPDILNYYGEILETTRNDILTADYLYFKALTRCPSHKGALMNRQRTAHVVEQIELSMFQVLDEKRDVLKNIPQSSHVFQKFKKQAYYLHIYHTVGIEGNTMSIEQLRYLLETGKAVFGKSIIEHNEILGLQLAMKYVKILARFDKIEIKEILGIHRRIMGHVDPITSGLFRDSQVYVGDHVPPSPNQVSHLMNEFVDWFNSEEASNMHPIRYAALAHYKLVDIHPFADGNGRTSRLLMNLILIRAGYPPVIILKEHRQQYYDLLKLANQGDVRPFVRFVAQCTEQILDLYLWGAHKFAYIQNIEDFSSQTISSGT